MTTYYVGNHYEVKASTITKYYFAGSTRVAVRKDGTLNYLLGDHLGSSSLTTNASGIKTAQATYKAFGETRYAFGSLNTDYKFAGQREEASLGLYFYGARWFDPSLGRFISPDTIVPTGSQGTQAWDRYAYVNGNPVRYTDPTGHAAASDGKCDPAVQACATPTPTPLPTFTPTPTCPGPSNCAATRTAAPTATETPECFMMTCPTPTPAPFATPPSLGEIIGDAAENHDPFAPGLSDMPAGCSAGGFVCVFVVAVDTAVNILLTTVKFFQNFVAPLFPVVSTPTSNPFLLPVPGVFP